MLRRGMMAGGGGGGATDPYWANVVSLLHFDGAGGSTTATDEKGVTWNLNGNAQLDTGYVKYGTAALLLDGTDDYAWATHASLNLGGGDYTVEGWAYYGAPSFSSTRCIFSTFLNQTYGRFILIVGPTGKITFTEQGPYGSPNFTADPLTTIAPQTWFHWAVVREGTTLRMFKDGIKIGEWTSQPVYNYYPAHFRIGRLDAGTYELAWLGSIDELRITKGVARYTADFTPPSAPFPNN